MVYLVSKDNKPLMPTKRHGKVIKLLKQGLAKVIKRKPFTIQLLYDTDTCTQPVTVGVDIGSKTVGISAITEKEELFSGEIELRNDIKGLLFKRREYRRSRRYRKTRYRKSRFLNRKRVDKWLASSIQWRVNAHIKIINMLAKILSVAKVVVEIAPFNTQKILNPDIQGKDYQNGVQKGFWDVREYCLWRSGYKSELSGKKGILEVHHIISRGKGGTNTPSNLIVLTADEHKAIHENKIKIPASRLKKVKILKDASYVSIIGLYIVNRLNESYPVEITYGSITKSKRIANKLEKADRNDAFVIANGTSQQKAESWYFGKFFRRQNRSLHKANPIKGGKRPVNIIRGAFGFKRFDKVKYDGKVGIITGLRNSGYFAIRNLNGDKIHDSAKYGKLRLLEKAKTLILERRLNHIPLQPNRVMAGVSCG